MLGTVVYGVGAGRDSIIWSGRRRVDRPTCCNLVVLESKDRGTTKAPTGSCRVTIIMRINKATIIRLLAEYEEDGTNIVGRILEILKVSLVVGG